MKFLFRKITSFYSIQKRLQFKLLGLLEPTKLRAQNEHKHPTLLRGLHSLVDLSVPSILPPWVQVQAHNLRFYHV